MRRRLLVFAGLLALGAGIAAAVVVARNPSARHVQSVATTRPRPPHRARPKPRIVRGPHVNPVPILMYHVLAQAPAGAAYPQLWVSPADFAAQMNWLAAHGYHAVTLGQLFEYWRRGVALPSKPFVATFDDGYLSDFTVGLPTLKKHGWAGVLNLIVNSVGSAGLGAGQVRALIAAGWEIDAHTVTHADLVGLDPARLRYEVSGSRARLRAMFHQPVDFFCYPAGHYDAAAVAAVRAAGFLGATTENPGLATPTQPYTLNRIRVDSTDGLSGLVAKLQRYGP
ncbi:MAG TPA: polysaccharide deacetylase family protein [Gaiellaceae bacterium]